MRSALVAAILGRNAVLDARVDAAIAMGVADAWLLEGVLEEKRHIVELLTALRDQVVGGSTTKPTPAEVAVLLEGLVDRVRLHLDVSPADLARIRELLEAGVEAIDEVSR